MASINDISIALNSLFLEISEPITLGLNKGEFLKCFKNIFFKYTDTDFFEFSINPILNFNSPDQLMSFLRKEQQLSINYQDFSNGDQIQELINKKGGSIDLEDLYLEYSIEINQDEIVILFNTNSMIFKYEVIG